MTADKQLKAYIDRVLRLKEEQDTIGDDIREIYAEAKAEGYDKTIMGKLVAHLRKELKQGAGAVAEAESIFDTYLTAYQRASGTPVATHTHAPEDHDPVTGEILDGNVSAKLIATVATGMQTEIGRKALIAAVDIMIEQEEAEEDQPETATKSGVGPLPGAAGADGTHDPADDERDVEAAGGAALVVTIPQSDDAAIAEVKGSARLANVVDAEPSSSGQIDPSEDRSEGQSLDAARADANAGGDHVESGAERAGQQDRTSNNRLDGVPVQSADGITLESVPPMPMKTLSYSHCFPELSITEYRCLAGDIAMNGVLEPIIRMGDVIVDGWNRYNAARSIGIEYPVKEYSGDDVLLDVIAWQRASRKWTQQQERKIAASLAKAVPHRAADIKAAFHQEETGEVAA